eukprot:203907_1
MGSCCCHTTGITETEQKEEIALAVAVAGTVQKEEVKEEGKETTSQMHRKMSLKEKMQNMGSKASEIIGKKMADFMAQMKILTPAMTSAGYKFTDFKVTITLKAEIKCMIENVDDDKSWDESFDESQLDKIGKSIVFVLKKADQTVKLSEGTPFRLRSFTFILAIVPKLELKF